MLPLASTEVKVNTGGGPGVVEGGATGRYVVLGVGRVKLVDPVVDKPVVVDDDELSDHQAEAIIVVVMYVV